MYKKRLCLGREKCGLCAGNRCISFGSDGLVRVDFSKEEKDLSWVSVCPSKALTVMGREKTIDEILDIVERDSVFYRRGSGGLTVSGGEPLYQANTVILLRRARERYINTSIECCGMVDTSRLMEAAEYLDEIFFDIKSMDPGKHREWTGMDNSRILYNFTKLCETFPDKKITARTPVIPGFNDNSNDLDAISDFLSRFKNVKWEKLPYHEFGVGKYAMLGRRYLVNKKDS